MPGESASEKLVSPLRRIAHPAPLPPRPEEGHKGMFGRVLIVGGDEQMIGAPVLAGTAALRMGAGLVQIAVPRSILSAAISITPELIGLGLGDPADDEPLLQAAEAADAVVAGPGLGRSPVARERLSRLIRLAKPMVLDADALNLLAEGEGWPDFFKASAILTPHPGEMRRLAKLIGRSDVPSDDEGRVQIAAEASRAFGQIVVLKGHRTVVTDGVQVYINDTGDSTLSKAGTGDVLSGMIGCLLAQELAGLDAATIGVHLHGLAGELAGEKFGRRSALARDVLDMLPAAIARYEKA